MSAARGLVAAALLASVAACPSPAPTPVTPVGGGSALGSAAPLAIDAGVSQEETLAAIQKAMNELDEAAQGCWAAVAVERFDIEGELTAQIDIVEAGATTTIVTDTARSPKLSACLVSLLNAYRWAPPLHGQTIQLPFKFRAPADGQNVIDRALAPWNGQGKVSVSVLLDDANSGNDAASMFEVAVQAGGSTGMRTTERTEVWYFLGPATINAVGTPGKQTVAAGDMAIVPKGGARELLATAGDVHAVLVMVPGGREGAARAGALPTPPVASIRSAPVGATVLRAATAKTHGPATIYAEPAITKDKAFAASILSLPAGTKVAEHVHANESELLYVLEGSGTMTVAGTQLAVTSTSVIQIPPNTKHAFVATTAVRSVQLYTPAGPEQRFKQASATPSTK